MENRDEAKTVTQAKVEIWRQIQQLTFLEQLTAAALANHAVLSV